MILQTRAQNLCTLLATESGPESHLEALRDALILAQATAFTPPDTDTVSNDRTTLPHTIRS